MRDLVAVSLKLADKLTVAENAISGAFFRLYSTSQPVKASDIAMFRTKASEIARNAISDAAKAISAESHFVASEAASRAYADVSGKQKQLEHRVNCAAVQKGITALFLQYIADGESILSRYASRIAVNKLAGWSSDKAVSFAKSNTAQFASAWSNGKLRMSRFPLHHSLFLLIASHITASAHMAYIEQAVKLGKQQFQIVQSGHKRDGTLFDYQHIPFNELHPQSRAHVRIMES